MTGWIACKVRTIETHPEGPYGTTHGGALYDAEYPRIPVAGDYVEVSMGKEKDIVIRRVWRVLLPCRAGAPPVVMVEPE